MPVGARSSPSVPIDAPMSRSLGSEILTPAEVAEYLKISKKTVYKMAPLGRSARVQGGETLAGAAGGTWRVDC